VNKMAEEPTLGETIENEIKEGMERARKEKIGLYISCTGERVEVLDSYPFVSDETLEKINGHIEGCDSCRETFRLGSYQEQKY